MREDGFPNGHEVENYDPIEEASWAYDNYKLEAINSKGYQTFCNDINDQILSEGHTKGTRV